MVRIQLFSSITNQKTNVRQLNSSRLNSFKKLILKNPKHSWTRSTEVKRSRTHKILFNIRRGSAAWEYFLSNVKFPLVQQTPWAKVRNYRLSFSSRKTPHLYFRAPVKLKSGRTVSRRQLSRIRFFLKLASKSPKNINKLLPRSLKKPRQLLTYLKSLTSQSAVKKVPSRVGKDTISPLVGYWQVTNNNVTDNPGKVKSNERLSFVNLLPYSNIIYLPDLIRNYLTKRYAKWFKTFTPTSALLLSYTKNRLPTYLSIQILNFSPLKPFWIFKWVLFLRAYSVFTWTPFYEMYAHYKSGVVDPVTHNLYLTFNKHRFVITLTNSRERTTHLFITAGILLKYFQNRKSLKKNKAMRLLMARFLRKVLIILKLKRVVVYIRGIPLFFELFLNMLYKPLSHVFVNPLTGVEVDETLKNHLTLNIYKVFFNKVKPFGYQKTRKKGRVKRKIRRKLVKLNKVID